MVDRNPDDSRWTSCRRRTVLRWIGAAAGGAAVGLVGCGPAADPNAPPEPLEVPLADLPPETRVVVRWGVQPVELFRTADGVRARSLVCTHVGCTVVWTPDQGRYLCPCHEGQFDADGNVVAGPPPEPLRSVPLTVRGDVVVLGA